MRKPLLINTIKWNVGCYSLLVIPTAGKVEL
jgi:hypothetical protein